MPHRHADNKHAAIVVWLAYPLIFSCLLLTACGGGSSSSGGDGSGGGTTSYTVGGSATGVAGTGLMLQLNAGGNLAVSANGAFTFPTQVASGATYAVTIASQPSGPTQTCVLGNATGTVSSANVTNVSLTCTTNSYSVGGSVSGLSGDVVLQDNGGDNLTVSASGAFTFATRLASGASYAASVLTQPTNQTCHVTGGSGAVTSANISNVMVSCTTTAFTVGGTVNGLNGSGLVLQDNGGNNLSISASGSFAFSQTVSAGNPYAVTVMTQPSATPTQYCTVSNGSGTVGSVNINNVTVTCRNRGQYLYVTTSSGGGGTSNHGPGMISFFGINPDGTLNLDHASYTVGLNPLGLALDSSGQYFYVTYEHSNLGSDGYISTETITTSGGSAGQFTENESHGEPVDNGPGTSTYALAIDPTAPYVFAGGTSSGPGTGTLYVYATSSGVLTQLTGSPVSSPFPLGPSEQPGGDPYGLAIDPTGTFLYVPTSDGGLVWGYSINSDASLTNLPGTPFTFQGGAPANTPYAIAINPNGGYLYITDNTANTVTVYSYSSSSGTLTEVGTPYSVGKAPESVAVDPTGQFLYVANSGAGTVSGFTINASTGALTPMAGSPFFDSRTGAQPSGSPMAVAVEPSGQFAYVANGDAATITVFSITPGSGVLTTVQSAEACPYGPTCTVAGAGGTGGASALVIE